MTRGQRRLLGAVGCLVVVASLAWAVAAAAGDGGLRGARGTRGASASADTTLPLIPVTSGAPLPTTTAAPPHVPLPTPEQVAAAVPPQQPGGAPLPEPLGAQGALLRRPSSDAPRTVDRAKGCRSVNDPGWHIVDCGALRRTDAVLLWVVQQRGTALQAMVLRERTARQWTPVLVAAGDTSRWSRIGVRGEDVSGDGHPDLVFGFHLASADRAVAVDVVDTLGAVGLHVLLPGGAVRVEKGALHAWAALADGSYDHDTYRVIAGAWRVASSERARPDAVPPSMV